MHLKHSSPTQLEPEIGEASQTINQSSLGYLLKISNPFSQVLLAVCHHKALSPTVYFRDKSTRPSQQIKHGGKGQAISTFTGPNAI